MITETTILLRRLNAGDRAAADELYERVGLQMRGLAGAFFRDQRPDHTLQPTALVHEAFVKLLGPGDMGWESRAHFLAVAARAMRQILIDHARAHGRQKRGGGAIRVTLGGAESEELRTVEELLDLEDALARLAALDERQGRIVELRFYGGMNVEQVAHVLGVSKSTVEAEWRMARAWLKRELDRGRA